MYTLKMLLASCRLEVELERAVVTVDNLVVFKRIDQRYSTFKPEGWLLTVTPHEFYHFYLPTAHMYINAHGLVPSNFCMGSHCFT